jgi:hypothetical protein
MKKLLITMLMLPVMAFANSNAVTEGASRADKGVNTPIPAGSTVIMRQQLGSGTPGFVSFEPATHLGEGIYHAPQYLPAYPTAATLWPRVLDVNCTKERNAFVCDGYNWMPAMGRGEYLFIRPTAKAAPAVVERLVVVPGPVREVLVEVPAKPKKQ